MISFSSILWRLVVLGILGMGFAFYQWDMVLAQEIALYTGFGMAGATLASLFEA